MVLGMQGHIEIEKCGPNLWANLFRVVECILWDRLLRNPRLGHAPNHFCNQCNFSVKSPFQKLYHIFLFLKHSPPPRNLDNKILRQCILSHKRLFVLAEQSFDRLLSVIIDLWHSWAKICQIWIPWQMSNSSNQRKKQTKIKQWPEGYGNLKSFKWLALEFSLGQPWAIPHRTLACDHKWWYCILWFITLV